MSEAAITLQSAALGYPGLRVLDEVDLVVRAGQVLAIVGDNGSGKSTLLRTLAGILPPRAGRRVVQAGLRIGYVPQQAQLDAVFPYTVEEVIAQGLARAPGPPRTQRGAHPAVQAALERAGLADRGTRRFGDLSGGQKQRALLARATVQSVDLLLLDEPTAGVDHQAEERMHSTLAELAAAGTGVVLVTHHPEAWEELADAWCDVIDGRVQMRESSA